MTLSEITDHELIANLRDLVIDEREQLALQLECIAEFDRRKLFFHYASLRAFLIEEYGMEEWSAERKIRAARMLKRFPEIKNGIQSGKLNLTLLELTLGCAHREKLKDSEISEVLITISGMSTRSAMRELASRYPRTDEFPQDVKETIRPLSADFSEVTFVASNDLLEKLDEIRDLMSHAHPKGLKMGELMNILATEYRKKYHPEEKAKRSKEREVKKEKTKPTAPRLEQNQSSNSLHSQAKTSIPKRMPDRKTLHELTLKDGYQCSYVDEVTKMRCHSKRGLEVDHIRPWSENGETKLANLRYLCFSHHKRVSFLQFGESSNYFKAEKKTEHPEIINAP